MTTKHRRFFAPGLIALALLAGCQSTKKAEDKPVTTVPATTTAPATKVVMTGVPVESSKTAESQSGAAEKDSDSDSKTETSSQVRTMPVSSPSSEYTENRLRDMEKGLRRLQSIPSGKAKNSKSTRNKLDL